MKKITTLFAAAVMAASASAQTVTESKTFDNMYFGINTGVSTATKGHHWLQDFRPNLGVRLGRNFTPVFGLAAESNIYFKEVGRKQGGLHKTGTAVNGINTSLLGTVNLTNWVGGYKGEPRCFEVSAVYGLGWGHVFSNAADYNDNMNMFTSKAGLDFAFNLGKAKAWQLYVGPSMNWALNGNGYEGVKYDINRAMFQVNVGLVYKFKNSNGTHNFTLASGRDQAEVDALNAQINSLREQNATLTSKDEQNQKNLSAKDAEINNLKKALDECNKRPAKTATATNLQPTVIFRQGKSVVDPAQVASIELIANYMKNHKDANVEIKGYASPEGSKELNQRLSEKRAEAVKDILVKKYKISANRLKTTGMGATDKLFEQVEFNRVATFNDSTKD
uniref:OmpA family protein n=1 Tax=Prevotella sp. TaxID=59823 RepID=UPI004026B6E5